MRSIVFLSVCLGIATTGNAEDRVIGLLSLPEVLGPAECLPYVPQDVSIYSAPVSGKSIGIIRVKKQMTLVLPAGGCEGPEVVVDLDAGSQSEPLPTMLSGYDTHAVVVTGRRGDWFKIRLGSEAGWVRRSATDFHGLDTLFAQGSAYMTGGWDRRLSDTAGGRQRPAKLPKDQTERNEFRRAEIDINVTGSVTVKGELWFHIEVLTPTCTYVEPTVVDRGWVKAYGESDELYVWFYAKGC